LEITKSPLYIESKKANLRGLGIVNTPETLQIEMDVERLNNYFLTRPLLLLNGASQFDAVSCTNNVPEFSFAALTKSEISDAVIHQVGCRWC
jgi:hypothetical protein